MINGAESELKPLESAQKRLAEACMGVFLNPAGAAISGFVNSMLTAARLDAVVELMLAPPNSTWTLQEALEAATAHHMRLKAEQLESQALQAKLAHPGPQLLRPS